MRHRCICQLYYPDCQGTVVNTIIPFEFVSALMNKCGSCNQLSLSVAEPTVLVHVLTVLSSWKRLRTSTMVTNCLSGWHSTAYAVRWLMSNRFELNYGLSLIRCHTFDDFNHTTRDCSWISCSIQMAIPCLFDLSLKCDLNLL